MYCVLVIVSMLLIHKNKTMDKAENHYVCRAWNMRTLNAATPYLLTLLNGADIIFTSEHCLYENELWKLDDISKEFNVMKKASTDLKSINVHKSLGHCGVAIFWRKSIETHIKSLPNLGTDRMCVIKILTAKSERDIIFVGVYKPHRTCKIANYDDEIEKLEEIVKNAYTEKCHIVVMGDINAHFGVEVDDRCWGQTSTNLYNL